MTPSETVLADLQAQHPEDILIAKQTTEGLVIMRCPKTDDIDKWERPRKTTVARRMMHW